MPRPQDTSFDSLFTAFRDARSAYRRLKEKGRGRTDQDLARDPDYRLLHRNGMVIARLGGPEAIEGAIRTLCAETEGKDSPDTVRADFDRYWAGLGERPRWQA
jgi:hypothetical protein